MHIGLEIAQWAEKSAQHEKLIGVLVLISRLNYSDWKIIRAMDNRKLSRIGGHVNKRRLTEGHF